MSVGTTLVQFKSALVSKLTARPGLAGVQISYGFPDEAIEAEAIWLQDANSTDSIPTFKTGPVRVEEVYTVVVACQVLKSDGSTQEEADTRAVAILSEVQQALAVEPRLIDEILYAQLAGWKHSTGVLPTGNGHGSRFDVQVQVRARLHP
ncbi:hypothetical protein [Saccharopolyspora mangrovi]|uniref:DUF3168 domain-containing protein n=1 Tax=Saccharopolyspora mangrovi TaxID=3082379 RepID=A0ABU6A7D1_9PSEU|nr:hypothetical protein [Saccharopolyspora sp. S2-29]MEB3367416.1 hypothetical protein [Saccharopolyspora sp. S2-29]